jgi:GT2 family glycosyltransferase
MLVRTNLLKKLGGFDPRFFLYWEEMDLCKRIDGAGSENWFVGTAVGHHIIGESSSGAGDTRLGACLTEHHYQSRYYFMVKHHGRVLASIAELGKLLLMFVRLPLDAIRGHGFSRLTHRLRTRPFSMPNTESTWVQGKLI